VQIVAVQQRRSAEHLQTHIAQLDRHDPDRAVFAQAHENTRRHQHFGHTLACSENLILFDLPEFGGFRLNRLVVQVRRTFDVLDDGPRCGNDELSGNRRRRQHA